MSFMTAPAVESGTTVELAGQLYPLVPNTKIQKTDISPYVLKVAQGDPKYGDGTVASTIVMRDWRSGLGIKQDRPDKPGRFWDSTLDTRFPYQMTLQPQFISSTTGEFLVPAAPRAFGEIAGVVVAAREVSPGEIYSSAGGATAAWTLRHTAGATAGPYQCFFRYTPPGGVNTLFAFNGGTTNNYTHSTDGVTWAATKSAPVSIYGAVEYDRKLIAWSSNAIYFSVNPSDAVPVWTEVITGLPFVPRAAALWVDEKGAPAVVFLGDFGLYRLEFHEAATTLLRDLRVWLDYTGATDLVVHNGALMVATRKGVLRFTYGVQTVIGPNRDDGFDPLFAGDVVGMASDSLYLWVLLRSTSGPVSTSNLLVWDDLGWHRVWVARDEATRDVATIGSQQRRTRAFYVTTVATNTAGFQRFYIASTNNAQTTSRIGYFELPGFIDDPLAATGFLFEWNGDFYTPKFDGGFVEVPKGAYELHVAYDLRDPAYTGNRIDIYYALDNLNIGPSAPSVNWTFLGVVGSAGNPADFPLAVKVFRFGSGGEGISFRKIAFRVRMERHNATPSTSPVLNYMTLKYVPQPDLKFAFTVDIDLSPEALADCNLDFYRARAALDAARRSIPLLDFYEVPAALDGVRYQVKVANKPEAWDWALAEQHGRVRLTLTEVI